MIMTYTHNLPTPRKYNCIGMEYEGYYVESKPKEILKYIAIVKNRCIGTTC